MQLDVEESTPANVCTLICLIEAPGAIARSDLIHIFGQVTQENVVWGFGQVTKFWSSDTGRTDRQTESNA